MWSRNDNVVGIVPRLRTGGTRIRGVIMGRGNRFMYFRAWGPSVGPTQYPVCAGAVSLGVKRPGG